MTDFGGKTSIFSHPVYLFLRKFSLQDSRGGSEVLAKELVDSGVVYGSGHGIFPSEQVRKDWIKAHKEMSKGAAKKKSDPGLIYSLPDGEIRHYDRRQNIICLECRKSKVMQRVLAFYQGNFQEVMA